MASDPLRPQNWDEYIGQPKLKERLSTHIQAATWDWRPLGHVLLDGPPGVGKTSMANLIADQLGYAFESFVMPMSMTDLFRVVLGHRQCVILLDEIHRLRTADQEELLYPLEDGVIKRRYGTQPIPGKITIVGATTEPQKLIKPLRERFPIRPRFEPYTDQEMAAIVRSMGRKVGIEFTEESSEALGRAAAGSPRQAKRLVMAARDTRSDDPTAALELAGVTPEGLTEEHIEYLQVLYSNSTGFAGVKVLGTMLRLPEASIEDLEGTLLRLDMIEYTPRGRSLKGNGYHFISQYS